MEKEIQILVVDDHDVVREGIRRMLGDEKDMELVGQGANSDEALLQVELLSPDIVLSDIKMPGVDGIELTRQIMQKFPACKVIMLTLYDEYLNEAMEAGAKGYLLKDIKRHELAEAIRQVYDGKVVISQGISTRTKFKAGKSDPPSGQSNPDTLLEELQLIIPPPVEANQLMRFASQVEDKLQSRVLQVVGSWREGTAITMLLNNVITLGDILHKLGEISEIERVAETPLSGDTSPTLLKKAGAIPKLKDRPRKTIFVTLEKEQAYLAS